MAPADRSNRYGDYLRKKFRRYSLGVISVMFVVFVVFMALNILVTTVLGTRNRNRSIGALFEQTIAEYDHGLLELAADPSMIGALRGERTALHKATELLYDFANSAGISSTFLLIDRQGEIVSTSLYRNNYLWFQFSLLSTTVKERVQNLEGAVYHTVSRLDYGYDQNGDYLFATAVTDWQGEFAGYILFDLKDTSIYEHMLLYNLDQVTITDRFDNIIFTTQRFPVDPMEKYPTGRYRLEWTGRWTAVQNGISYFVDRQPIADGEMQVFALTSIAFQQQMLLYGSVFLVIAAVLMMCIMSYMTQYTTRRNLASIEELAAAAKRIGQGDLSYRVRMHSFDEFQVLGDALNLLSENLQQMIARNEELSHHKQILELKHLENQFNPHFIYNTMEAIRYKILMEPSSAAEMVFVFANLMRYSMNFGAERILFSTDVGFLRDYLTLQKMRFGERLHYSIDIEEALLVRKLPKLLLQPLVENSLRHGTRSKRTIALKISGKIDRGIVLLSVQDDGDGIPDEVLLNLRDSLKKSEPGSMHFGLYSVNRTVQLMYGEAYGISVESVCGEWTTVTIHLPDNQEDLGV